MAKRKKAKKRKAAAKNKGTVVQSFKAGGCDRVVRAKQVRHKGGSHTGYFVSKVDKTCGRKKRKAKRKGKK